MPYNVTIMDDSGHDIGGLITFITDDGDRLGEMIIPVGGAEIDPGTVEMTAIFRVTHPGYGFIAVAEIYDDTVFTLYKQNSIGLVLLGALGFWLLSRIIKF